jgi:hypothetical protein
MRFGEPINGEVYLGEPPVRIIRTDLGQMPLFCHYFSFLGTYGHSQ